MDHVPPSLGSCNTLMILYHPNCHPCCFVQTCGCGGKEGVCVGVGLGGGGFYERHFKLCLQFSLLLNKCDVCLTRCGWSRAGARTCLKPVPTGVRCTRRVSGGVPSPPLATPPTLSLACRFPLTNHKSTGLAVGWPCCVSWTISWESKQAWCCPLCMARCMCVCDSRCVGGPSNWKSIRVLESILCSAEFWMPLNQCNPNATGLMMRWKANKPSTKLIE